MKHSGGSLPREVPDATVPGLYVVIYPSGKKSWALRYRRPDGRPNKLVLGSVNSARDDRRDVDPAIGAYLTDRSPSDIDRKALMLASREYDLRYDPSEDDAALMTFMKRVNNDKSRLTPRVCDFIDLPRISVP